MAYLSRVRAGGPKRLAFLTPEVKITLL